MKSANGHKTALILRAAYFTKAPKKAFSFSILPAPLSKKLREEKWIKQNYANDTKHSLFKFQWQIGNIFFFVSLLLVVVVDVAGYCCCWPRFWFGPQWVSSKFCFNFYLFLVIVAFGIVRFRSFVELPSKMTFHITFFFLNIFKCVYPCSYFVKSDYTQNVYFFLLLASSFFLAEYND